MGLMGASRRMTGRRRIRSLLSLVVCSMCLLVLILISVYIFYEDDVVNDDVMVVIKNTADQKEYIDRKGIHVIIGQYMGSSIDWNGSPNLTNDILDSNNYSPIPKAGEMGLPVYIPDFESHKMKLLYHVNKFNLVASDRISVNRSLPDPRKESCKRRMYDVKKLPNASVIIVFHNEAWSTLLRTVHSVLNRTPKSILREIILVDDASQRKFLKDDLKKYLNDVTKASKIPIRLLRAENRTGLVRARLMGAKISQGTALVFLDAHVEATIGWLEPLLDRISDDKKRVVCPVIDVIHDETFAYAKSFELHWGAFNWNLHFRWFPLGQRELIKISSSPATAAGAASPSIAYDLLSRKDDTSPFMTPVMAGGLFAIDKDYFYSLGAYDEKMDIWGGENIEMSLRVWTCGGRLEISPCSHVAHLFRKSSPYTFGDKKGGGSVASVLYSNLARVAEVWMDDYKNFFYAMNPTAKKSADEVPTESLIERKKLRQELKCKNFQWFLDHVWPEHFFPSPDRFFGQIKSFQTNECIQKPGAKGSGVGSSSVGTLDLEGCAIEPYSSQSFVYTKKGFIMTDDSVCFDITDQSVGSSVLLLACSELKKQKWKYDPKTRRISHVSTGFCLTVEPKSRKRLIIDYCQDEQKSQMFDMISVDWSKSHSHFNSSR